MRYFFLVAALPVILLVSGCQTLDIAQDRPDYTPVLPRESSPETEEDLPHPEFAVDFYVPEIPESPVEMKAVLPLPEYREPMAIFVEETVSEDAEPVEVDQPVKIAEPVNITPVTLPDADAEPAEPAEAEPLIERDETFPSGEISLIILEGTDWFFLEEEGEGDVEYVDRSVREGKTLFSFQFPDEGKFILIFQRQDHSTGTTDKAEINVTVQEEIPPVTTAVPEEENREDIDSAIIDAAAAVPATVIAAEERLQEIEENPEKVEETLNLLEFLMDAASDDETLAGYYYRMARTLEMNTRFQDLRKAYETYQYIENQFFLTDYYELALERIRYLDRHFFKLR